MNFDLNCLQIKKSYIIFGIFTSIGFSHPDLILGNYGMIPAN